MSLLTEELRTNAAEDPQASLERRAHAHRLLLGSRSPTPDERHARRRDDRPAGRESPARPARWRSADHLLHLRDGARRRTASRSYACAGATVTSHRDSGRSRRDPTVPLLLDGEIAARTARVEQATDLATPSSTDETPSRRRSGACARRDERPGFAILSVPMIADHQILGVLSAYRPLTLPFDKDDLAAATTFAGGVAAALLRGQAARTPRRDRGPRARPGRTFAGHDPAPHRRGAPPGSQRGGLRTPRLDAGGTGRDTPDRLPRSRIRSRPCASGSPRH